MKLLITLLLLGFTVVQAFGQNYFTKADQEKAEERAKEKALLVASVKPLHPEGWAREQAFFKERRAVFLAHMQGAKNIVVAKRFAETASVLGYDGIKDWKINWPEQRKFCTKVAKVLFKDPTQMSFPEPNFSAYRDPAEKLLEQSTLSYPTCADAKDMSADDALGKKKRQSNPDWLNFTGLYAVEGFGVDRRYYTPQFQMYERIYRVDDDDHFRKDALDKRSLKIEYSAGIDEGGCGSVWGGWGGYFEDHNINRDINSKVVTGVIDGEFIFFEFGTYNEDRGGKNAALRKSNGDWFGKPNQRYVLATGARHNLNHTLVAGKGQQSAIISSGAFPGGRMAAPYDYGNACVFNFDAPTGEIKEAITDKSTPKDKKK